MSKPYSLEIPYAMGMEEELGIPIIFFRKGSLCPDFNSCNSYIPISLSEEAFLFKAILRKCCILCLQTRNILKNLCNMFGATYPRKYDITKILSNILKERNFQ